MVGRIQRRAAVAHPSIVDGTFLAAAKGRKSGSGFKEDSEMMIRHALPFALILLAGCARSEQANFTPADNISGQEVERVRTPDSDEEELSLGQWRAGLQDEQTTLEFGPAGAPPLLSLRCDARRGTLIQRYGAAPAGDLPVMLITVGSETRRLDLASTAGAIPMLRATLAPTDVFRTVLSNAA